MAKELDSIGAYTKFRAGKGIPTLRIEFKNGRYREVSMKSTCPSGVADALRKMADDIINDKHLEETAIIEFKGEF